MSYPDTNAFDGAQNGDGLSPGDSRVWVGQDAVVNIHVENEGGAPLQVFYRRTGTGTYVPTGEVINKSGTWRAIWYAGYEYLIRQQASSTQAVRTYVTRSNSQLRSIFNRNGFATTPADVDNSGANATPGLTAAQVTNIADARIQALASKVIPITAADADPTATPAVPNPQPNYLVPRLLTNGQTVWWGRNAANDAWVAQAISTVVTPSGDNPIFDNRVSDNTTPTNAVAGQGYRLDTAAAGGTIQLILPTDAELDEEIPVMVTGPHSALLTGTVDGATNEEVVESQGIRVLISDGAGGWSINDSDWKMITDSTTKLTAGRWLVGALTGPLTISQHQIPKAESIEILDSSSIVATHPITLDLGGTIYYTDAAGQPGTIATGQLPLNMLRMHITLVRDENGVDWHLTSHTAGGSTATNDPLPQYIVAAPGSMSSSYLPVATGNARNVVIVDMNGVADNGDPNDPVIYNLTINPITERHDLIVKVYAATATRYLRTTYPGGLEHENGTITPDSTSRVDGDSLFLSSNHDNTAYSVLASHFSRIGLAANSAATQYRFSVLSDGDHKASTQLNAAFSAGLFAVGDSIETSSYFADLKKGGGTYEVISDATATADGGHIIQGSGYQLRLTDSVTTPQKFGAIADGVTDDVDRLESFFGYIREKTSTLPIAPSIYEWSGDYGISRTLSVDLSGSNNFFSGRVHINGKMELRCLAAMDDAVLWNNCWNCEFGSVTVWGQGGPTYTTRTLVRGHRINKSPRTTWDLLETYYSLRDNVLPDELSGNGPNSFVSSKFRGNYCGTNGIFGALSRPSSVVQSITRQGNQAALLQRAEVVFTGPLPDELEVDDYLLFPDPDTETGFRMLSCVEVDRATNSVQVYPWPHSDTVAGAELGWVWGCNIDLAHSNDTNSWRIEEANGFVCGINLRINTAVGTVGSNIYSQASAANIVLGKGNPASFFGAIHITGAQNEQGIGIVISSLSGSVPFISGQIEPQQIQNNYAPRRNDDSVFYGVNAEKGNVILSGPNGLAQPTGTLPAEAAFGTQIMTLDATAQGFRTYSRSAGTLKLVWDSFANESFGVDDIKIRWQATRTQALARPTGTLVLEPSDADVLDGWLIGDEANGYTASMSLTAPGSEPPLIYCTFRPTTKRIHVRVI